MRPHPITSIAAETEGRGRRLPPQVFLADREKKILMVVIPLQVVAEVAIIVLDEHTPAAYSWFTWMNILHLVDIVCCCAILFPIVWWAPWPPQPLRGGFRV